MTKRNKRKKLKQKDNKKQSSLFITAMDQGLKDKSLNLANLI